MAVEEDLLLELGLEVRSVSSDMTAVWGGWGEREGRGICEICEAERDEGGKDESEVLLVCSGAFTAATPLGMVLACGLAVVLLVLLALATRAEAIGRSAPIAGVAWCQARSQGQGQRQRQGRSMQGASEGPAAQLRWSNRE